MNCAQELIWAAEQHAGVRPRRRPELVTQRIEKLHPSIRRLEGLCARQETALTTFENQVGERLGRYYHSSGRPRKR